MDLSFLWKLPPETRLGRLVRLPLRAIPQGTGVPILQGPARGKKWMAGAGPSMFWFGSYESAKQKALAGVLSDGDVFYDVGAHMGFFSLLGASVVGPRGRVVAFEPVASNVAVLRRHVELNHLENVDVHEQAVADRVERLVFDDAVGDSFEGRISDAGTITVDATTLDRVVEEGTPPPNVVKLDIEGAELSALEGAKSVIEDARPVILVATHGDEVHEACRAFLVARGYRVEPLRAGSKVVPAELVARPSPGTGRKAPTGLTPPN